MTSSTISRCNMLIFILSLGLAISPACGFCCQELLMNRVTPTRISPVDQFSPLMPSRSSPYSSVALFAASPPPGSGFPEVERPDPATLVAAQSDELQRALAIVIGLGIVGGTFVVVNFLSWLGDDILPYGLLDTILGFTVPVPLGLLFVLLGATHFLNKDEYAAIVPPKGSWGGVWNVPAPGADKLGLTYAEYHTLWAGVAEIGGGLLFVLGGLNALPIQIPAFLLFVLTLAVTPANVYMFTHDAQLSMAPPIEYPFGHLARAVLQSVLLALFWFFAFQ